MLGEGRVNEEEENERRRMDRKVEDRWKAG